MSEATGPVRLRVAPSPTGDPHVGTAYMSLFNLAFVRQQGGQFVLRVEDTDRARYRDDSEQQLYDTLSWLGLHWDEGPDKGGPFAPYRQSERLDTCRPYVERLLADGHAYHCWCSTERLAAMRARRKLRGAVMRPKRVEESQRGNRLGEPGIGAVAMQLLRPAAGARFTPLDLRQEEGLLQDVMNGGQHDRQAADSLHCRIEVEQRMAPIGAPGDRPHF